MPAPAHTTRAIASKLQRSRLRAIHPGIADALQLGNIHAGRDLPMIARPVNSYRRRFKI